ncbi:FMN-dependent NADH-azoreductase [Bailinhaonella thermotolerans]|uniref:FMN dependent NADH:quinone oxidoreductase n=1 Tax=Bailinhaonella thermotolerans TaxID=1070861 RepID=A0A3A4AVT4_9ACTN|nr:NAD(P)H-dependent oxidoreductase [Bailinhaonella thermotolerans]RJL32831.1 flavodoxin family protein [Bailinhaonella thermotolerans]
MSGLLYISASPRGAESISGGIAETFIEEYRATHPGREVERFDLWDGTLPEFGPAAAAAKMTVFGGGTPEGEQAEAWDAALRTFERFDSFDRYLFGVPMWNAGVPYKLKQFIDVVSQPAKIFEVHPETGYRSLLTGKRAAVIYTSAVWGAGLGPEFGSDFQSTFFNDWLRWTGIQDIQEIRHHPTLTGSYDLERKRADERAREIARTF